MLLDDLRCEHRPADRMVELSMRAQWQDGDPAFRVWFRVPDLFVGEGLQDASPFVVVMLPLCMRRGEALNIRGPVSPMLLQNLPEAQSLLSTFYPGLLTAVEVQGEAHAPPEAASGSVCLFSRGVDSWHSLLTHDASAPVGQALTHAVFVPSVDIWDAERAERDRVRTAEAANRMGLETISPETNIREHAEPILDWTAFHGAFLAGCGLALGPARFVVPSSFMKAEVRPHGSHHLLDGLWSTERTAVVHHGNATRLEKVAVVATSPAALTTLRCCWQEEVNCNRCDKCLHTMIELEVVGAIDRCSTFEAADPTYVAAVEIASASVVFWRLLAARLPDDARGRELALAIDIALLRHQLAIAAEAVERVLTSWTVTASTAKRP